MKIKVKCPAKINLTLKVFKKDETTGFHPIESIMQAVTLFDYLTIETTNKGYIDFSGSSKEITYDDDNLVIKAINLFFDSAKIKNNGLKIYLEKNIPVAAGLAGGSTDAAGMVYALNYIYNNVLSESDIYNINSKLGSDINFCYKGGCALCKGKGDEIEPLKFNQSYLTIIKPKGLKISTKDAYSSYDKLKEQSTMPNDLEFAISGNYPVLASLQKLGFQMSGSGPSFFIKQKTLDCNLSDKEFDIFENLEFYEKGVSLV